MHLLKIFYKPRTETGTEVYKTILNLLTIIHEVASAFYLDKDLAERLERRWEAMQEQLLAKKVTYYSLLCWLAMEKRYLINTPDNLYVECLKLIELLLGYVKKKGKAWEIY